MKKTKFKEWDISVKPAKKGWQPVIVSRDVDSGVRRTKRKDGTWCTLSATRTKFSLAWNGERFAEGNELKAVRKRFPALYKALLEIFMSTNQ